MPQHPCRRPDVCHLIAPGPFRDLPPFPVFMSLHGLCIGQWQDELERRMGLVQDSAGW